MMKLSQSVVSYCFGHRPTKMGIASVFICFVLLATLTQGCSTRPVLPDKSDVKVSRTPPTNSKCQSIGPLEGRSMTAKGTSEEALGDVTKAAAHRGANFVHIQSYSETGTAVRAEGFICP